MRSSIFHAVSLAHAAHAYLNSPLYVAPVDLTSTDSIVRIAWDELSSVFDRYYAGDRSLEALTRTENVTFSASMFSLHDSKATSLQYHHTAPQIASPGNGTRKVDGNSMYRVASVSKLITAYLAYVSLTQQELHQPITYYLPELKGVASPTAPKWEEISLWSLVSQLSGIDALGFLGDLLVTWSVDAASTNTSLNEYITSRGMPLVDIPPEALPCLLTNCTTIEFLAAVKSAPTVIPASATALYSDIGFMIAGAALSRAVGKPFDQLYSDAIFKPLQMSSTSINAPLDGEAFNRSVIVPGDLAGTWSFPSNYFTIPSGGVLSTVNDLNKLGIAILNSTLLPVNTTRTWLQPHSHTASLTYSVGAPWEIVRYINDQTGRATDLYTKLGDSGSYGSILVIIPEYDAGFTFLNAYLEDPAEARSQPQLYDVNVRSDAALKIINQIAESVIPALEEQAALEACHNFAGTYAADALNSSLTVSCDCELSGLAISEWVSNGTDMIKLGLLPDNSLAQLQLAIPGNGFAGSNPGANVTLQASTNLQTLTYSAAGRGPFTGIYHGNFDWLSAFDGQKYVGAGVQRFVFSLDEQGYATSVTNSAARLQMLRK